MSVHENANNCEDNILSLTNKTWLWGQYASLRT